MSGCNILISGMGIAGPTLAWWLMRHGFEVTLIERAPALRSGGYVIDFWGLGFDVAERMGLVPDLRREGYDVRELRLVDREGRRAGGFDASVFARLTGGRYVSIERSALARLVCERIDGRVETIFGDSIAAIDEDGEGVAVSFHTSPSRRFDLVIGADGLHSEVRRLVFGPQGQFEHRLGYGVAALDVAGYRPRDEGVYVSYSVPGRQVARFALRGDRTLILFVFAGGLDPWPHDLAAQKRALHAAFDGAGWECQPILAALDPVKEIYFDRVSQIRMPGWSRGRVALLGDAAFCPSLLAGQGSALAMAAAYVLAGEIVRSGGEAGAAFARYETTLRGFMDGKQKAAEQFARSFAPRTRFGIMARNLITRTFNLPFVAEQVLGRGLIDRLDLPDYGMSPDQKMKSPAA